MLREIDGVATFLPYRGDETLTDEDEGFLRDGLTDYFMRWEEDLQPALSDLQLVAGGKVADLAERASGALMEITGVVKSRGPLVNHYPAWFRAQDLCVVLRNAMRSELGVQDAVETTYPRPADWPWLDDRASEEEYIRHQTEIPGRPPLTPAETARVKLADGEER